MVLFVCLSVCLFVCLFVGGGGGLYVCLFVVFVSFSCLCFLLFFLTKVVKDSEQIDSLSWHFNSLNIPPPLPEPKRQDIREWAHPRRALPGPEHFSRKFARKPFPVDTSGWRCLPIASRVGMVVSRSLLDKTVPCGRTWLVLSASWVSVVVGRSSLDTSGVQLSVPWDSERARTQPSHQYGETPPPPTPSPSPTFLVG